MERKGRRTFVGAGCVAVKVLESDVRNLNWRANRISSDARDEGPPSLTRRRMVLAPLGITVVVVCRQSRIISCRLCYAAGMSLTAAGNKDRLVTRVDVDVFPGYYMESRQIG